MLSACYPSDVGLGLYTSKDMIWELPTVQLNEISRQVVYSPKTNKFVHVILRYTDEDELESEYKILNDNMTLDSVKMLVARVIKNGKSK